MVFSGIKRVNIAFMKKVQKSMKKFREILEGFIPKSEKFKHQLGHISYFFSANLSVEKTFVVHKYFLVHVIKTLGYLKFSISS